MSQSKHGYRRWIWLVLAIVAALVAGGITLADVSEQPELPGPTCTPPPPAGKPAPLPTFGSLGEYVAWMQADLERMERDGSLFRMSGPSTRGSTIHVAGIAIDLPDDAYVAEFIHLIGCLPGYTCPRAPLYVIARGNSRITLSAVTGEVASEDIAPGEEAAFDFLREVLR